MKTSQKGEIITIITIATLVVVGISTFVSSVFLNSKKISLKSKASEVCQEGGWRTECVGTNEGCPSDAGVEHVWQCQEGNWVYKYPQCATRCRVRDAGEPSPSPAPTTPGCQVGQIINEKAAEECDTNIGELVYIEEYYDNNCQVQRKPGRRTGKPCEKPTSGRCEIGAIANQCVRQECDKERGYYVCIQEVWTKEDCSAKEEKPGVMTSTPCVTDVPIITSAPTIAWPTITPGGGKNPIIFSWPTPTPIPGFSSQPVLTPPSGNVPLYKTPRECMISCGEQCTPITDPQTGKRYYVCQDNTIPQNDCRCINGSWQGGLCDGWLIGRSCSLRQNCLADGAECRNNDSCCSGVCQQQQGTDKYICASKTPVVVIAGPTNVVVANECARAGKNAVCKDEDGVDGVCHKTGLFGLGDWKCLPCNGSKVPVAGKGCIDLTQKIGRCSSEMGMRYEAGKCFVCVGGENLSGKWIAVNPSLCEVKDRKFSALEILNNTISSEDQYQLRQQAYNATKAKGNFVTKVVVTTMQIGDVIGNVFGRIGSWSQRAIATVQDTVPVKIISEDTLKSMRSAEGGSSVGGYYQQNLNTKLELEKQGKVYKVNLGQALVTGLAGGLKYADMLTMGITNKITGGGIDKINDAALTAVFGDNEALKKAALSAQAGGSDLTNVVSLIVPAGKMTSLVGRGIEAGGARLAASGIRGGGVIQKLGTGVKIAGRGVEYLSPEAWSASFIKSAPISTSLEVGAKAIGATRPVQAFGAGVARVANTRVGKVVTAVTSPVVRAGEKVVDFFIPRSALTYSADEAAGLLARDIKLGLVTDAKSAAARLKNNYHINFSDVTQVDKFIETMRNNRVGNFDLQVFSNQLKSPLIRQENMAARLQAIDQVAAGGTVDAADVLKLNKKFSDINNPTVLAEAILFDKEVQVGHSIINDPAYAADVALAKAQAQAVMNQRAASGFGIRERVIDAVVGRFGKGRIADIKNQVLSTLDVAADRTAIETKLREFGFSTTNAKALENTVTDLSERLRLQKLPDRLNAIRSADLAKVADKLTTVDERVAGQLGKKFGKINNPDELAEAVLHEWEKMDKTPYISNSDQLAAAQAYAKRILSERTNQLSFGDRVAGLFGGGKQKAIEEEVLLVLKPDATPTTIRTTLENFGYYTGNPAAVDRAVTKLSEKLRSRNMPERLTALRNVLKDPNFSQVRQEVEDSIVNNLSGAKDNLNKYAKQFKEINDPDQLAEAILHEWEKTRGSLVGDAHELAAAQAYASKIIAGRTKPFNFFERLIDKIAVRLGKGTARQEKQALNYILANGLAPTDDVFRDTLARFGYRGDTSAAVRRLADQAKDIARLKDLPNRLNIIKNPDPNLLSQKIAAYKPQDVIDGFNKKFTNIVDPDELAEAILYEWEKMDKTPYISNPDQLAAAQAYAAEIMSQRAKQAFSPVDYVLAIFGRGRKADIERRVLASLSPGADRTVIEATLKRFGYPDANLVAGVEIINVNLNQPAIKKQFTFFERISGFPQKLEDQVFNGLVKQGIKADNTTAIMEALKKEGYPIHDLTGRGKNLAGATQRIRERLQTYYASGGPAGQAPIPKQNFSWWERLLGKPQRIENQVRRKLRGGKTLDEYKNALRSAGYAEGEIDAAAARIEASFSQAAPMSSVPQNVPIKKHKEQSPPPATLSPPAAQQGPPLAGQAQRQRRPAAGRSAAQQRPVPQPRVGSGAVQSRPLASHGNVVQDAVYVRSDKTAFAVADGVTGAGPASAETARRASQTLADKMATEAQRLGDNYSEIYRSVNDAAHALDTGDNGSATVVAGYITPNGRLITYRIGDTEARIIRDGQIAHLDKLVYQNGTPLFEGRYLNPDLSFGDTVQSLVYNMPNQIGGGGMMFDGRLTVHSLRPGDRIIYTSDGIAKVLKEKEIRDIVSRASNPQEAEKALIEAALGKGLKDDYSAVVIFY